MTNGKTMGMVREHRRVILPIAGLIVVTLAIGVFFGGTAAWVTAAAVLVAGAVTIAVRLREGGLPEGVLRRLTHSQFPDARMKKLLFDDFQGSSGKYLVREVEEEPAVVPSSKTVQPAAVPRREEAVRELDILDFFDLDTDTPLSEVEPRSEFHSLINKVLLVLKDVLFAHTTAYFWVNREKGQVVLESMATDSELFMEERRFPLDGDLVSGVANTGKPRLVGDLSPIAAPELLRYYRSGGGVRSVVAVPVFLKAGTDPIQPVGVLVADSLAEDAFGHETLTLLGKFTRLVSALVKSYTDKYDLLLDSELLSSIRRMADRIRSSPQEEIILSALSDEVNRLAGWDVLTITMYSEEHKGWILQKVVNKPGVEYVTSDQIVDVGASLVGEAIRSNKVELVGDMAACSRPRFHSQESIGIGGAFLVVPISSFNRCYGALTVESKAPGSFAGSEVETLYRLVENAAAALEVVYMNTLVKDFVTVDHLTGSLIPKHFHRALEEEVLRAEDFATELALVSIAVDGVEEHVARYGTEAREVVLREIAGIVRAHCRPYDVLGLQGDGRLGVLLVNTTASDAYVWAERIRKLIASHTITVARKTFSVTVSVGVSGLTEGMRSEELVAGTSKVLEKAMETGGNLVRVL